MYDMCYFYNIGHMVYHVMYHVTKEFPPFLYDDDDDDPSLM